jgi:hypothetical protein
MKAIVVGLVMALTVGPAIGASVTAKERALVERLERTHIAASITAKDLALVERLERTHKICLHGPRAVYKTTPKEVIIEAKLSQAQWPEDRVRSLEHVIIQGHYCGREIF